MPFCRSCGNEVETGDRFCETCGTARAAQAMQAAPTRPMSVGISKVSAETPVTPTQQAAPLAASTPPPSPRPNGKLPCAHCGVDVAAENMDYHVGNAHREAARHRVSQHQAVVDDARSHRHSLGVRLLQALGLFLLCWVLIAPVVGIGVVLLFPSIQGVEVAVGVGGFVLGIALAVWAVRR